MKTTEYAKSFIKKFDITYLTYNKLDEIINQLGFKIKNYSPLSRRSMELLDKLNLVDYASKKDCFTYSDDEMKLVFVREFISESDCIILLLHEIGHIILGHISEETGLVCANLKYENEANEFAFTVKSQLAKSKAIQKVKTAIVSVIAVALSTTIFFIGYKLIIADDATTPEPSVDTSSFLGVVQNDSELSSETNEKVTDSQTAESSPTTTTAATTTAPEKSTTTTTKTKEESETLSENSVEEVYYITKTGDKYHREDCHYIAGHAVVALTLSELENMGYQPCSYCIGENEN